MKNIQPVLFFFETINTWNFRAVINVFKLTETKKYSNMFDEVYIGLSHPQSKYELYFTSNKGSGAIGFALEDKDTNQLVLMSNMQQRGTSAKMYPDWMLINMDSFNNKLSFYDTKDKMIMEIDENMVEEEHFQNMMLYDLPPYETYHKAIEVYKYLSPIAKRHRIGFSVDYNHLDMDFDEFFPSNEVFDTIDSIYGNALELFYEAENHGNPFNHYTIS